MLVQYEIGPARKIKLDDLIQALASIRLPFREWAEGKRRAIGIGPDIEYELLVNLDSKGKPKTAFILIRYANPVIDGIVSNWMEKCGLEAPEEFYKWHNGIAPSTLKLIQRRWNLDLSKFSLAPFRFAKNVLVFYGSTDLSGAIGEQLKSIPHRKLAKDEFIRCDDWGAAGDMDTDVYRWPVKDEIALFVTMVCAPASTTLCLWAVQPGASVEIKIGDMPNQVL
jgi:hypothetical protein